MCCVMCRKHIKVHAEFKTIYYIIIQLAILKFCLRKAQHNMVSGYKFETKIFVTTTICRNCVITK